MNIFSHTYQYFDRAYVDGDQYKVFYVSNLELNSFSGNLITAYELEFELACDLICKGMGFFKTDYILS